MQNILVTGATGELGSIVVNELLDKKGDFNIIALARTAEKAAALKAKGAEIRIGDYNNLDSLKVAFKDVDAIYFISGNDIPNRLPQHKNVVDAAVAAKVGHVYYTSFCRKDESENSPIAFLADSHIKTEQLLADSGLNYTILKHNIYADVVPSFLGEQLLKSGTAYYPAGDGQIALTTRADMAAIGAEILVNPDYTAKSYEITNNKTVTFAEMVAHIAEVTGKEINYISPSQQEYKAALKEAQLPDEVIGLLAGFAQAFKQNELDQTNNLFEEVLGRPARSVKDFLTEVYS